MYKTYKLYALLCDSNITNIDPHILFVKCFPIRKPEISYIIIYFD